MTFVRDGMTVAPLRAGEPLVVARRARSSRSCVAPEVLVLGGGPAGLAAAAAAAEAGAEVVLVDERAKLGGQFYKQPPGRRLDEAALDRQYRDGRRLIRRVEHAGRSRCSPASRSGAATGPAELLALDAAHAYALRPRRLVLATGAYERGVPLPGWTLPGLPDDRRRADADARLRRPARARRVLVSGNGPLNIQVAAEIVRARRRGRRRSASSRRSATPLGRRGWRSPVRLRSMRRGRAADLAELRRAGVPLLRGHAVVRAEGDGAVERAVVARIDARPARRR